MASASTQFFLVGKGIFIHLCKVLKVHILIMKQDATICLNFFLYSESYEYWIQTAL